MPNNLTPKEEFLLNPVEEHNITDAAVASFETNLKHPLKVTVPITPQQDLHGYDHPWPNTTVLSGNCENATKTVGDATIISEDGTFTLSGSLAQGESLRFELSESFTLPSNLNKVTLHFNNNISGSTDLFFRVIYDNGTNIAISPLHAADRIFQMTSGANQTVVAFEFYGNKNVTIDGVVMAPQFILEANICPINGFNACSITGASKNLLDKDQVINNMVINNNTNKISNHNAYKMLFIPVRENTTYTFMRASMNDGYPIFGLTDVYPNVGVLAYNYDSIRNKNPYTFNTGKHRYAVFTVYKSARNEYSLTLGSTAIPAATPYVGTTLPITFTDPSTGDPMTIYSGSLTLNEDGSADLVCPFGYVEYDGSEDEGWLYETTAFGYKNAYIRPPSDFKPSQQTVNKLKCSICDTGTEIRGGRISVAKDKCYISATPFLNVALLDTLGMSSATEFRAWLQNGHTMQVVGELSSPRTYHFPNVGQLKAFLGENNVWSDIGNVDVKYLTQHSETGLEYRGDRALELRRRAMMADAPTVHTTVGSEETGGLASFKSYVKAPVKKIEIPFSPKQDLHGYDHPWPAGGNINKLPPNTSSARTVTRNGLTCVLNDDGTFTFSGTTSGGTFDVTYSIPETCIIEDGDRIHLCNTITSASAMMFVVFTDNSSVNSYLNYTNKITNLSSYAGKTVKSLRFYIGDNTTLNATISPMIVASGSVTPFSPYENICPIEGYDECDIKQVGKNFIPTTDDGFTIRTVNGTSVRTIAIKSYAGAVFHWTRNNRGPLAFSAYWCDKLASNITATKVAELTGHNDRIISDTEGHEYFLLAYPIANSLFLIQDREGCLTVGSEDSSYEEHKEEVLPLIFNQSGDHEFLPIQEGTGTPSPENVRTIHPGLTFTRDDDSVLSVYGGTLTVNEDGTSNVSATHVSYTLMGGFTKGGDISGTYEGENLREVWNYLGNGPLQGWQYPNTNSVSEGWPHVVCSNLKTYALNPGLGRILFTRDSNPYIRIYLKESLLEDVSTDIKARESINKWCYDNPIQVVYDVKTPETYALSVTETNRALEALGLTQHIGPLYGGTITINSDGSADVVSDKVFFEFDGSENWQLNGSVETSSYYRVILNAQLTANDCICSHIMQYPLSINNSGLGANVATVSSNMSFLIRLSTSVVARRNIEVFKTWLATQKENGTPLQCIATLSSPTTYHFSNLEQLKVWLGENNFWCDISDDITVKYWNRG